MKRRLLTGFSILSAAVAAAPAFAADAPAAKPATAPAARPAEKILADLKALTIPEADEAKMSDPAYREQYANAREAALQRRTDLTGELYKAAPDSEDVVEYLPGRWRFLALSGQGEAVVGEITAYLAKHPAAPTKAAMASMKAQIVIELLGKDTPTRLAAFEEFRKAAPASRQTDAQAAAMLLSTATQADDTAESVALLKRVAGEFPNAPAADRVPGELKRREGVGKPVGLAFTDAVSGKPVDLAGLKGKVVVIDFWATWCGPCVAEMPNLKKLYAAYKDKGVEFIGVSLDEPEAEGGLKALKEFVAKNGITWPQYYPGKGMDSEFSSKRGIDSIPAMFAIDADGKLASVNAFGKLDTLLPELIKKRDAGAAK